MRQQNIPQLEIPRELQGEIEFTKIVKVLDLPYLHLRTKIGDDLYITQEGIPYWQDLLPDNFARDREWFNAVKIPLPGSSTIFRVPLKIREPEAVDVVFKWNRMGTDPMIPEVDTAFNSPFDEFSLISELGSRLDGGIRLQQPLAVYVPSERYTLEVLQRRRSLMDYLQRTQPEEHIDMYRDYAVIFRWIPGRDLYEYTRAGKLSLPEAEDISKRIAGLLDENGYVVTDHKMNHIIADSGANFSKIEDFTLIDFELLHRTANHEVTLRKLKRQRYFELQLQDTRKTAPEGSNREVTIFGVTYIQAETENTGRRLWAACSTPDLVGYYAPEKWQTTPRQRLSRSGGTYLTTTKEDINVVIKESQVGERPLYDPLHEEGAEALSYGYNSPFEEAAISLAMEEAGLPVIRLRAIYQLDQVSSVSEYRKDMSRYSSHAGITGWDGNAILMENRQYLTFWQYWEGSDEEILMNPRPLYEPVNLLLAFHRELVDRKEYETLLRFAGFKLKTKGYNDLGLKSTHLLFLVDRKGMLVRDDTGMPAFRFCNFALMKAPGDTLTDRSASS